MSETKQFFFPEGGNNGSNDGNGMWNNPWWALIFLAAFRNNGGLFGGDSNGSGQARFDALQEQLNSIQGQNALMAAIAGGANEVKALATTLNCDINAVQNAINEVRGAVSNGVNGVKQLITEQGYQNQLSNCQQTNMFVNNANDNTRAILAKLDAIEDSRKDRELAEKDRVIATLTARSERQAELQPIYSALQEIQCNQPPVKKIVCPEQYIPINKAVNETYGLYPNCNYGFFNPFLGFNNGFNNAF